MGKATVYCETCGEVIPGDDFAKGRAVRYQEKDYCAKCKQEISHLLQAQPETGPGHRTSRIGTVEPGSPSGIRRAAVGRQNPSGARRTAGSPAAIATPVRGNPVVKSGNGHHDHPSTLRGPTAPAPAGSSSQQKMYLIAGGALVVIILLLVLMNRSNTPTGTGGSGGDGGAGQLSPREKLAKEAYERCDSYHRLSPNDVEGLLRQIQADKEAVRGTAYELRLRQLELDAEDKKKKADDRKALENRVAEACQNASDPTKAAEALETLQKLQQQVGDDAELKQKIQTAMDVAQPLGIQNLLDEARQYHQVNPMDYDGTIKKLQDISFKLDQLPKEKQALKDEFGSLVSAQVDTVKQDRENDADSRLHSITQTVDADVAAGNFAAAEKELNDFIGDQKYATTRANATARTKLADVITQAQQKSNPPQQPPPGQQQPPGQPGVSVSLFDGKNRPGLTLGNTAAWDVANGELHVKHNSDQPPPNQTQIALTDVVEFTANSVDKCVFEFEAKVMKGGFAAMVGMHKDGTNITWTAGPILQTPNLPAGQWHKFRIEWDGINATISINGQGAQALEKKSPARGCAGLGVYPGCDVYFRNINLTEK